MSFKTLHIRCPGLFRSHSVQTNGVPKGTKIMNYGAPWIIVDLHNWFIQLHNRFRWYHKSIMRLDKSPKTVVELWGLEALGTPHNHPRQRISGTCSYYHYTRKILTPPKIWTPRDICITPDLHRNIWASWLLIDGHYNLLNELKMHFVKVK